MKKKNIIAIFALLFMIAIVSFSSQTKVDASGSWQTRKLYETRTFNLIGKGHPDTLSSKQSRTSWSLYEPTGIFVNAGETITIQNDGTGSINAYVQSYGLTGVSNSWTHQRFDLKNGLNTITSTKPGVLYLGNNNTTSSAKLTVTGGSFFPIFVKGYATDAQFKDMLNKYPNTLFVEFVSERGIITVPYSVAKEYYAKTNATPATTLVNNLDTILAAQDYTAGYDNLGGVNQQDYHYRHLINDTNNTAYMYSTSYRTAYVGTAINSVLSGMTSDGWGPWHENGHQTQNKDLDFHNMTEVNVNNYSLAAERALGLTPQLKRSNTWPKITSYLNTEDNQKNYHEIKDLFTKLGLYQQLHLSFGQQFMPNLNRAYRETPATSIPITAKDQKFIYMTSKVSGYNLIPYFEKWGLPIDQLTKTEINKLDLQTLNRNIWNNTDDSVNIMPNIDLESNKVSVTMSKEYYSTQRVILVYKNGQYLFEATGTASLKGFVDTSNAYTTTIYTNTQLKENDLIEVRFGTGKLGQIYGSPSIVMASKVYKPSGTTPVTPPTVNITLSSTAFTATLPTTDFKSTNRIVYYVNGAYFGETYNGAVTSKFTTSTSGTSTILTGKYNVSSANIKVDAYLVPGTLSSTIDLSKSTLLKSVSGSFPQATLPNVNVTLSSTAFTATLPTTDFKSTNRIVYYVNGAYFGETYNGSVTSKFTTSTSGTSTILTGKYNVSSTNIKVDAYLVPGTLSSTIDLSKSTLLKSVSGSFPQATLPNVNVTLSSTAFTATLPTSDFISTNRIVYYVNGAYFGETYNGAASSNFTLSTSGTSTILTGKYNASSTSIKVDAYLVPGTLGSTIDLSKSTLLKSVSENFTNNTNNVTITPSATGFSATMNDSLFKSTNRVIFVINGVYAGETYNSSAYYLSTSLSGTTRYLSISNKTIAKGTKVEAYLVSGTPGNSYNLNTSTLLKSVIY